MGISYSKYRPKNFLTISRIGPLFICYLSSLSAIDVFCYKEISSKIEGVMCYVLQCYAILVFFVPMK
jgi:hypothetical protein